MAAPKKVGMGQLNQHQKPMAKPTLKKTDRSFNGAGLSARSKAAKASMKGGY